jgi:predicted nucleic acid-binding protein
MSFTLDTNVLIGLIQRYPRDIFSTIWENIEGAALSGDVCICEAVLREVRRGATICILGRKGLRDSFVRPLIRSWRLLQRLDSRIQVGFRVR